MAIPRGTTTGLGLKDGYEVATATTAVVPRRERRQYLPTPFAPRDARRFVDHLLDGWGCDRARASAILLTSELVADAIRQAPTSIALHVELTGDTVRLEVSDDPGLVGEDSAGRFERRVARSLMDELASDWGSDVDRDHTRTWFSMCSADADHGSASVAFTDPKVA